jgi:biopolymer transport protein TolQ
MNTQPVSLSAWTLIMDAGPLVKLILLLLFFASVLTWAVLYQKTKLIKATREDDQKFIDYFWSSKSLDDISSNLDAFEHSTVAKVFASAYRELRKMPVPEITNLERALNRAQMVQLEALEKNVDWLATIASAAPFIGLFGTVWGIMNSFQNIGATGSANLAIVAPGISEALIATAVGLAAAIPASIGYNSLLSKIKRSSVEMETFSQEFLNMVQRNLASTTKAHRHGNESEQSI